jgi:hypothetical protein
MNSFCCGGRGDDCESLVVVVVVAVAVGFVLSIATVTVRRPVLVDALVVEAVEDNIDEEVVIVVDGGGGVCCNKNQPEQ